MRRVSFYKRPITLISCTGIVKTQWYKVWIGNDALRPNTEAGTTRELDVLHAMLREVGGLGSGHSSI